MPLSLPKPRALSLRRDELRKPRPMNAPRPIMFACGALARDIRAVCAANRMTDAIEVQYLPANLHNTPSKIVEQLRPLIATARNAMRPVFVGYSDCGTGGLLDAMLAEFPDVERLPGAHCYELFAGSEVFAALHDAEPGTFYLTDFLALHFDALVWNGLGLDRHPELRDRYFAHYTRVVYLSQDPTETLLFTARSAAAKLELAFEHCPTTRLNLSQAMRGVLAGAIHD